MMFQRVAAVRCGALALMAGLFGFPATGVAAQPRGYSIPLIDLAAETNRQVIVDREKGQYLGHPSTVLLEDNKTILAVYPKGHGKGALVLKRSGDAGLTWSERLPVPDNWATHWRRQRSIAWSTGKA